MGVCSADISSKQDEFSGGRTIESKNFIDYSMRNLLDCIIYSKVVTKDAVKYALQTDVTTIWDVPYQSIRINVDGDYTFDLPISNLDHWIVQEKKYDRTRYIAKFDIPNDAIEKIKNASRIALQCTITRRSGNQFVYVLPDNVLDEWKQVIATEE